ncbi:hypothetical protein V6N11_010740 [Hibiscus sabdariffa]|uniref:Uncharacterized protein n=1 Tax=Hibiscus sabdariffa TaxID=183260 RepID=A0ABR2S6P5_9ROSI
MFPGSRITNMKGRTHRAEPHDDWGDGSWTASAVSILTMYREFPCWDEKKEDNKIGKQNEIESGNPADNGAGVLFSLSKDRVFAAPMCPKKDALNEGKKSEVEDLDGKCWQNGVGKDRAVLQPAMVPSSKQTKDENGLSKDRSTRKKARSSAEKVACEKKRAVWPHKTVVFRPSCDPKQLEFYEDRVPKCFPIDVQSGKNKNLKDSVLQEPSSYGNLALNHAVERPQNNSWGRELASEVSTSGFSGHDSIRDDGKEEKADDPFPTAMKTTPKTEYLVQLPLAQKYTGITPAKEEGDSMGINKVDDCILEGSTRSPLEYQPQVDVLASTPPRVQGNHIRKDSNSDMSRIFNKPDIEAKREINDDDSNAVLIDKRFNRDDTKDTELSFHQTSETSQINDLVRGNSQSSDSKPKVSDSELVADCHSDKTIELSGNCSLLKCDLEGSEASESVKKSSSDSNHIPRSADEAKPSINVLTSEEQSNQCKMVACAGKSSSDSSAAIPSIPDSSKPTDTQNNTKLRVMPVNDMSSKKDHATNDVPRDEDRLVSSHKMVKEHPKSSFGILQLTVHGESADSLQSQSATYIKHNKTLASGFPQKGERFSQSNTPITSKITHASSIHPFPTSNSPTLSDEELALLLHQELNSSPRVPRVPRVRQTGSFPQLASATATSMLMKRTSSSGGKDHSP